MIKTKIPDRKMTTYFQCLTLPCKKKAMSQLIAETVLVFQEMPGNKVLV